MNVQKCHFWCTDVNVLFGWILTQCLHFFLTQNVPNVISLVSRLNYTKLTSFNVVLFCNVDDVKAVKDKVKEEGATDTQIGHFYVQNSPCRSESQGTYTVLFILVLHESNC